jgi:FkbM family methyltransferase
MEATTMTVSRNMADPSRRALDRLFEYPNAEAIRDELKRAYPAFAGDRLKSLAIIGAAGEGARLAALCEQAGITVAAICDDDPAKIGCRLGATKVTPSAALNDLSRDTPIVIASHRTLKATQRLRGAGFTNVAPFALLQVFETTRFPPHMFYDGWLEHLYQDRHKLRDFATRLKDDRSREVLDKLIEYRLTVDPLSLESIVEWDLYAAEGLFTYSDDEVYVDAGTFDGDTIRLFIGRTHGKFARIIGFEPDPATFKRLAANFAHDKRVEPINAGLYDEQKVLRFDADGSRGAIFDERGTIEIPVVSLDSTVKGDRITYIKMNIEGAEIPALKGARSTIKHWKPKLLISAYHRPSDLWEVAAAIDAIRPDYNFYLRQHNGGVIETVLYAVP